MAANIGSSFGQYGSYGKGFTSGVSGLKNDNKAAKYKSAAAPGKNDGVNNKINSLTEDNIAGIKEQNESQLSEKAQNYLKSLREKYGDIDFYNAGSGQNVRALAGSSSKEFSVIFSNEELEKMADDPDYADEKLGSMENIINGAKERNEKMGLEDALSNNKNAGFISKLTIEYKEDGRMEIFAELDKMSEKQKERLDKKKEKNLEEAKDKEAKRLTEKFDSLARKGSKAFIKADSEEDFIKQLEEFDWDKTDNRKSAYESVSFTA